MWGWVRVVNFSSVETLSLLVMLMRQEGYITKQDSPGRAGQACSAYCCWNSWCFIFGSPVDLASVFAPPPDRTDLIELLPADWWAKIFPNTWPAEAVGQARKFRLHGESRLLGENWRSLARHGSSGGHGKRSSWDLILCYCGWWWWAVCIPWTGKSTTSRWISFSGRTIETSWGEGSAKVADFGHFSGASLVVSAFASHNLQGKPPETARRPCGTEGQGGAMESEALWSAEEDAQRPTQVEKD